METSGSPGNKSYLKVLACLGTGGRRGAGSQTEGATVVGAPCLVRSQPSAASCAYASTTVPRATPSWLARVLVDGTVAPGASRPSRMAARIVDSIERLPSTGPDYCRSTGLAK